MWFWSALVVFNPLPGGTLATFFLTAVGSIQHTKEGDISREKTIVMTSLRLERAAAVRWRQLLITPLPPKCKGQWVQSNVMMQVQAYMAAVVRKRRYIRPPMSDEVADGVIRIAMKRCIHRHPKHPDQRPLRPPKLLLTKSAIAPAADVGQGRRWSHGNRHENTHL